MNRCESEWRPWIVLVGGFLGAGKTSLIFEACGILEKRGRRCAIVLNDQGADLVDTRLAELHGIAAGEVTGGCFCCKFTDLLSVFEELRSYKPEVIFAEPVGSCTDLVATVLQPLLEEFELCRLAPFTVLVDPARLSEVRSGRANAEIEFLLRKQIEEADVVCLTKLDRYPAAEGIPGIDSLCVSARSGAGVEAWLGQVLGDGPIPGGNSLELDYDRYARAEAALAWLNLSARYEPVVPASPASVAGPLLEGLLESLQSAGMHIAHLKLLDRCPTGWIKASAIAVGEAPAAEGILDAEPSCVHELTLNLRAIAPPAQLQKIVEMHVREMAGEFSKWQLACFSPPPPRPERPSRAGTIRD
jgi:CobW/HypB/UreG family nucleotide-binding protein